MKYNELTSVLFELDLMNTCCVENDMIDEYDQVSAFIIQKIDDGLSFEESVIESFDEAFWVGCITLQEINKIKQALESRYGWS